MLIVLVGLSWRFRNLAKVEIVGLCGQVAIYFRINKQKVDNIFPCFGEENMGCFFFVYHP